MSRLDDPDKHWKFSEADLRERAFWDKYQECYSDVLSNCSTKEAPWHVIPANHRWFRNYIILKTIVSTLENLKLKYPDLEGNVQTLIREMKEKT
jgi:polyphosphate kinase 2 (PPK2 family)